MSGPKPLPRSALGSWLAFGEKGISSKAMASVLTGEPADRSWGSDHPRDPADFRRCELLLRSAPGAREALPRMAAHSAEWARLVAAWDEIHTAITADVPNYLDRNARGSAPRGYQLMKRVIEGAPICTVCDGSGHGKACQKCKGTGRRSGGRCRAPGCCRGHFLCPSCRGNGYVKAAS